jgi:enamine deaminase RidA (YjgF/YER057c/UK114 family)
MNLATAKRERLGEAEAVEPAPETRRIHVFGCTTERAPCGDLKSQFEHVFSELLGGLHAAGATIQDVVSWRLFLRAGQDSRLVLRWMEERCGAAVAGAVSIIVAAGLADPGSLLEIDAVAVTPVV